MYKSEVKISKRSRLQIELNRINAKIRLTTHFKIRNKARKLTPNKLTKGIEAKLLNRWTTMTAKTMERYLQRECKSFLSSIKLPLHSKITFHLFVIAFLNLHQMKRPVNKRTQSKGMVSIQAIINKKNNKIIPGKNAIHCKKIKT